MTPSSASRPFPIEPIVAPGGPMAETTDASGAAAPVVAARVDRPRPNSVLSLLVHASEAKEAIGPMPGARQDPDPLDWSLSI